MTIGTALNRLCSLRGICVVFCILLTTTVGHTRDCDRVRSRLILKVINNEILPEYKRIHAKIPAGCPLDVARSMYEAQENAKYREHPNKWVCYECGKAFYEERYVDNHMDRRHPALKRTGTDVLCLADLCDVFRCEVLGVETEPSYWTLALCNERELQVRHDACQELKRNCVPAYLEESDRKILTDALDNGLCQYLNCKKFWEQPQLQLNPLSTAIYVMAFMVLSVALFIYYYIAYTHFYTDDSILDQLKADEQRSRRQIKYPPVPGREDHRVRYRTTHR